MSEHIEMRIDTQETKLVLFDLTDTKARYRLFFLSPFTHFSEPFALDTTIFRRIFILFKYRIL